MGSESAAVETDAGADGADQEDLVGRPGPGGCPGPSPPRHRRAGEAAVEGADQVLVAGEPAGDGDVDDPGVGGHRQHGGLVDADAEIESCRSGRRRSVTDGATAIGLDRLNLPPSRTDRSIVDWLDTGTLDLLPDPVIVFDLSELTLLFANEQAVDFFGASRDERLGMNILEIVHPDDLGIAMVSAESIGGKTTGTAIEVRVDTAHGWKLVELIGRRVEEAEGDVVILTLRDLTLRRRWEILHDDDARMRAMIHHTATAIFMLDPNGSIISVSAATTRDLGLDSERIVNRHVIDIVHPDDRGELAAALGNPKRRQSVEVRMVDNQGMEHPYQLHIVNLEDDPATDGYVVSGQDISALVAARDQLAHAADHDSLTGALNRAGFIRRLDTLLTGTMPKLTVAFVDLNDFKPINDTHGHKVGDHTLWTIAGRIRAAIREDDFIGRLGGDEFAIALLTTDQRAVIALTDRIDRLASQAIDIEGVPRFRVRLSIGAAAAGPGDTPETLLHRADQAMYEAKARFKRPALEFPPVRESNGTGPETISRR